MPDTASRVRSDRKPRIGSVQGNVSGSPRTLGIHGKLKEIPLPPIARGIRGSSRQTNWKIPSRHDVQNDTDSSQIIRENGKRSSSSNRVAN